MSGPFALDPLAAPFTNETTPVAAPVAAPAGPSPMFIANRVLGSLYITVSPKIRTQNEIKINQNNFNN
jgi:hypothetical protein